MTKTVNVSAKRLLTLSNSGYVTNSSTYEYLVTGRQKTWDVTPSYNKKKKLAEGKFSASTILPTLPYTDYQWEMIVPSQTVVARVAGYPYEPYHVIQNGNFAVPVVLGPAAISAMDSDCYTKAIGKLGSAMNGTNWNLPMFLKDFKSTCRMIREAALDIYHVYHDLASSPRQLHNLWLEYRYGWRLLIYDIYDSLAALHSIRKEGVIHKVKATSRTPVYSSTSHKVTGNASFSNPSAALSQFYSDCDIDYSYDYGVTITVIYRDLYGPSLGTMQQYGITNPALFAWDALPYSFVVDWFINIADYLQTLDVFVGKEFVAGSVSNWTRFSQVLRPSNFRPKGSWYVASSAFPPAFLTERYYKRTKLTSFPVASLPKVNVNIDWKRTADALALLKQLHR